MKKEISKLIFVFILESVLSNAKNAKKVLRL
jgi:hypothetical protein